MSNRHAFRAKWHDYCNGIYFVTICTHEKRHIFGAIIDGVMVLSGLGHIVDNCVKEIPQHHHNVEIWNYVIMPNHIHLIIAPLRQSRIWQRLFHEHIIRNRFAFENTMNYIDNNVTNWNKDCFYDK